MSIAAIFGATWSSRVCPVRSRRGAAQIRAWWMPLRAAGRALAGLAEICGENSKGRFFLDWYWRMIARLGRANASRLNGNLDNAEREAEDLRERLNMSEALRSAITESDGALKAQTEELSLQNRKQAEVSLRASETQSVSRRVPSPFSRKHRIVAREPDDGDGICDGWVLLFLDHSQSDQSRACADPGKAQARAPSAAGRRHPKVRSKSRSGSKTVSKVPGFGKASITLV